MPTPVAAVGFRPNSATCAPVGTAPPVQLVGVSHALPPAEPQRIAVASTAGTGGNGTLNVLLMLRTGSLKRLTSVATWLPELLNANSELTRSPERSRENQATPLRLDE